MDIAAGIAKSFATAPNFYVALGQSAVIAANGIVQLNNIKSASKGGGAISSSGGGAATATTQQDNFTEETASFDISSASDGGSSETIIRFATDSGDALIDVIAEQLNIAQEQGRA
jgi:hypothetical protein